MGLADDGVLVGFFVTLYPLLSSRYQHCGSKPHKPVGAPDFRNNSTPTNVFVRPDAAEGCPKLCVDLVPMPSAEFGTVGKTGRSRLAHNQEIGSSNLPGALARTLVYFSGQQYHHPLDAEDAELWHLPIFHLPFCALRPFPNEQEERLQKGVKNQGIRVIGPRMPASCSDGTARRDHMSRCAVPAGLSAGDGIKVSEAGYCG